MPQFAQYNPAVPAPSKVIGWYDTDEDNYPNLPASSNLLEVTADQYAGRMVNPDGWAVSEGALVAFAPPPPVLTLAQQATVALAAGFTITSASTPVLNGTFAVDDEVQSHIQAEVTAIMLSGLTGTPAFADGTATVDWPDLAVPPVNHTMTVAEFKIFAGTIGAYVAALFKVKNGTLTALPPASVTIP